jgi:hypothetical protein
MLNVLNVVTEKCFTVWCKMFKLLCYENIVKDQCMNVVSLKRTIFHRVLGELLYFVPKEKKVRRIVSRAAKNVKIKLSRIFRFTFKELTSLQTPHRDRKKVFCFISSLSLSLSLNDPKISRFSPAISFTLYSQTLRPK